MLDQVRAVACPRSQHIVYVKININYDENLQGGFSGSNHSLLAWMYLMDQVDPCVETISPPQTEKEFVWCKIWHVTMITCCEHLTVSEELCWVLGLELSSTEKMLPPYLNTPCFKTFDDFISSFGHTYLSHSSPVWTTQPTSFLHCIHDSECLPHAGCVVGTGNTEAI